VCSDVAYNILIVEDEMIISMEIAAIIKKMGHAVVGTAMKGEDAITLSELRHPDLVLMDIFLKGMMDGITAAEIIFHTYNIPVIYLTANSDVNTLERAMKTKPFGYLTKPVNSQELHNAIERALDKFHHMQ
jgi:DNA-binding NarL/FixJ family response regulator